MSHAYHYKKMQDEKKRKEEEVRKYGTVTPRADSLGRKLAKVLAGILVIGAIIVLLRFLFNVM
jgi:hypothetical protein